MELTNEKIAFKKEDRGFEITAYWGDESDARIEIKKDGKEYRTFSYPAYKIFNLAAHFEDIVDSEISKNDLGYRIAGSNGIGGCVMPRKVEK